MIPSAKIGWRIGMVTVLLLLTPALAHGKMHGLPTFSLKLTNPQILSLCAGYAWLWDTEGVFEWAKGVVAQVEPGVGGIKAHVGAAFFGKDYWDGMFCSATLSYLRTYNVSLWAEENHTYVGSELRGAVFPFMRVNIGLYRHVSGGDAQDWLLSAGIGIGF